MYKQWIIKLFLLTFSLVTIFGLVNIIVDPFLQYHKPFFYKKIFTSEEQRYLNAGIIKNYEFDSVLIGSSITENFLLKDMNNFLDFNKPIKLCLNGGSAYEHKVILKKVIEYKNIKNVLIGLDYFAYEGGIHRMDSRGSLPLYLYDNNILNDYKYIFSIDTFKKSLEVILRNVLNKNDPRTNLNKMYSWQHLFLEKDFNKTNVFKNYCTPIKNTKPYILKNFINSFQHNTLSIIKKNKTIKFIVIFPPYSILQYKQMEKKNNFKTYMRFKKRIMELLVTESNVEVFDFQVAKNIILDLSNYRDIQHYHSRINTWMLNEIKYKNFSVQDNTVQKFIIELENIVSNYNLPKDICINIQEHK